MRWFNCSFDEFGSRWRADSAAALVSLFAIMYLLAFNVNLLVRAGVPALSAYTATVLAIGFGTLLLGIGGKSCLFAGPSVSVNLFVAYTLILSQGCSFAEAMGILILSGLLLWLFGYFGWQEKIFKAVPSGLQIALRAGIGLWLLVTGAELGHLIVPSVITATALGDIGDPVAFLTLWGLLFVLGLWQYNFRLALGIGTLAVLIGACVLNLPDWPQTVFAVPDYPVQCGKVVFFTRAELLLPVFCVMLLGWVENTSSLLASDRLMNYNSTVTEQAEKKIPVSTNQNSAIQRAALATLLGGCLGAGGIAAVPMSLPGVLAGTKRYITPFWVVLYMIALLFCAPLAEVLCQCSYIAAPALMVTGCCLISEIRQLNWADRSENLAAVLLLAFFALGSMTGGMCIGMLAYCLLKLMAGEGSKVPCLTYILTAVLACQIAIYPG